MVSAAGGFGAIYLNKEIASKPHFKTWHSRVGLAALVGTLLVAAGGIAAKYSASLKNYIRPINVKLYHATLALIGTVPSLLLILIFNNKDVGTVLYRWLPEDS